MNTREILALGESIGAQIADCRARQEAQSRLLDAGWRFEKRTWGEWVDSISRPRRSETWLWWRRVELASAFGARLEDVEWRAPSTKGNAS